MPSPPLELVAAGRYRLISLLGKGGMGSVWRGEHVSLQTPVAIKLLDPRLAEKETVRARFLREARAAAALRSKHVVQIIDHGIEDGIPYIVMELLAGESLGERLHRDGKLPPDTVARLFVEMGRAIARAHKAGVVHRDLKPDNIFLAESLEESTSVPWVVKVVDFGIAKVMDGTLPDEVATDTGAMLGTPHYMSPEQARGSKQLDARTDLWSMAVIAYECLLGRRPFAADALGELVLRICSESPPVPSSVGPVPEGFDAWFARATQRKVDDRFQDVADLVRSLEDVLTPGTHHFALPTPSEVPSAPRAPSRAELESTVSVGDGRPAVEPASVDAASTPTAGPASTTIVPQGAVPRGRLAFGAAALGATALVGWLAISAGSEGGVASPPSSSASSASSPSRPQASSPPEPTTAAASPQVSVVAAPTAIVLTVRKAPKGAAVFRGKERLGLVDEPLRLPWVGEPFDVTIQQQGYKPRTVRITPAPSVDLEIPLEPRPSETPF